MIREWQDEGDWLQQRYRVGIRGPQLTPFSEMDEIPCGVRPRTRNKVTLRLWLDRSIVRRIRLFSMIKGLELGETIALLFDMPSSECNSGNGERHASNTSGNA